MSAKANAFSIAQLLDSTQADVEEYVSSKRSFFGKCMTPQQIELELEGNCLHFKLHASALYISAALSHSFLATHFHVSFKNNSVFSGGTVLVYLIFNCSLFGNTRFS